MALFSSAVDKFLFSVLIPRFLFRKICSTTEMLPAKEAWRIFLGKLYSPELREGDSTNFVITEFSEVRHSPGPTPRSVPDSELSRDRRPPRKAAVPFARAPPPCSRGQALPCGSKHPPARCSSLCRSLRYRCGGMRKPCGEVAFEIHNAAMYSVAMYTRIPVR